MAAFDDTSRAPRESVNEALEREAMMKKLSRKQSSKLRLHALPLLRDAIEARDTMRDTLTRAQKRGTELHNRICYLKGRVSDYREAAMRLAEQVRFYRDQVDSLRQKNERLAANYLSIQRMRDQMRDERNAVARATEEGVWVFQDTPEDDIESMSDQMIVTMTAKQLRALLAAAAKKGQP